MSNGIDVKLRKEHFAHIANIAKNLLANDLDTLVVISKDTYEYVSNKYYPPIFTKETINRAELLEILQRSFDYTSQLYHQLGLFDCFKQHFKAENPHINNFEQYIESSPVEYVKALKTICLVVKPQGTCNICKDWQ